MGATDQPKTIFTVDAVDDSVNKALRQQLITADQLAGIMRIALDETDEGGAQKAMEELARLLKGASVIAAPEPENRLETLKIGGIYRVSKRWGGIGGYRYAPDYDDGDFIHVRVLEGPDKYDFYKTTTRGEDGEHLGEGGGWKGDSLLWVHPSVLEEIS